MTSTGPGWPPPCEHPGDDRAARAGIRWWRLAAGVCLGLAFGSKWNGLWFVPAFAALAVAWDIGARRAAGLPGGLRRSSATAGWRARSSRCPVLAYLATWTGWFATSSGYDRNWAAQHGVNLPVISPLISLFEYNKAMLAFNTGLQPPPVPVAALDVAGDEPPGVLLLCAPTSAPRGCGVGKAPEVLAIGTPVIWWASIITLLVCLGWWLTRRDWRAGAVLVGVAAGWLPWFLFLHRTQFYFYSVAFDPVPGAVDHAVPGPADRLCPGESAAARGGRLPGRRLPARRAAQLRLPVPGAVREGHPVHLLAGPDVVPRLDLTAGAGALPGTGSRARARSGCANNRAKADAAVTAAANLAERDRRMNGSVSS